MICSNFSLLHMIFCLCLMCVPWTIFQIHKSQLISHCFIHCNFLYFVLFLDLRLCSKQYKYEIPAAIFMLNSSLILFFPIIKENKTNIYPCYRPWRPVGLWDVEDPILWRQSAHMCQLYVPATLYSPETLFFCF
jgi:hypothetical protein